MCLRPSHLRGSAIAALALTFWLGLAEFGALTRNCAAAAQEQPGSHKKKKEPNVDRGEVEKPPGRVVPVRRLSLKYKIFKRESDGHPEETSPDSTFMQDDRIQLKVTPSQSGYLYIIQSEGDKDGELIFPHSGIGGRNLLTIKEYQIPAADCDKKYKDDQGVCWLPIRSSTGRVWITAYFSPRQTGLPFVTQSGGKVSHQDILKLRDSAPTTEEFGKYGRQVTAARNGKSVAAGIELNHESVAAESTSQVKHTGSSPATNPPGPATPGSTGPSIPATVARPGPSPLWGKLEVEFDNPQANAIRLTLLKLTEVGKVPSSPLDSFKLGDRLNLDFFTNFEGYVYMLHVAPNGATTVVYPDSRASKKIKPNFRTLATMKRLVLNEKGVHTLQVVLSANRVGVLEEAIENKSGQLSPISGAGQQSRELGFDCANPVNLFPAVRRPVAVANDGSSNQAGAIGLVLPGLAGPPGGGADPCRSLTTEQVKGDKLKGQEVAVFEIRFKQV